MLVSFPNIFLLLISNFTPLCLENIFCIISLLLNLLRYNILYSRQYYMGSWAECICSSFGVLYSIDVCCALLIYCVVQMFYFYVDPFSCSITKSEALKSSTTLTELFNMLFIFVFYCQTYWSACMFTIFISSWWIDILLLQNGAHHL